MAGFAGHTVGFVGGCGGIIAGGMADQAGAGFTLLSPCIEEDRITAGGPVGTALPAHLELGMADGAILAETALWGGFLSAVLRAGYYERNPCSKQGEHKGD